MLFSLGTKNPGWRQLRRAAALSLWFAAIGAGNGCAGGRASAPDVPAMDAQPNGYAEPTQRPGSPEGLELTLRPPPSDQDPEQLVDAALHDAIELMHLMQSESLDPAMLETVGGPNQRARLLVDRAVNHAWVDSTPSAAPQTRRLESMLDAGGRTQEPGYLRVHVLNSGTSLNAQLYDSHGRMRTSAIDELSVAFRDLRAGEVHSIEARTLAMLYQVAQHFDAQLRVVSGYRVSGLNASRGSRHGSGRAVDFSVEGVSGWRVAAWIESNFANIGVGVYPTSGFVHLDTRYASYFWVDRSGPRQRSRTSTRTPARRVAEHDDPTVSSPHIPPLSSLPGE